MPLPFKPMPLDAVPLAPPPALRISFARRCRQFIKRACRWLLIILFAYQCWLLIHVIWYRSHPPGTTAFMVDRLYSLHDTQPDAKLQYQWVDYARISRHVKSAVLAAEDSRFMDHNGFDWEGLQQALSKNIARGKIVAGGSTISQQLAKNLFLSSSRNPLRKVQEAIVTVMLEQFLSKQRILELYLNVIEWGNTTYGVEAAARRYFGVSASALSPAQAARLAAMIPNPRFYQNNPKARSLAIRAAIYQTRMRQVRIP